MTERKLVSIRRIDDTFPIYLPPEPDTELVEATRIIGIVVGGWRLVTQRDNFKIGDLCVFFEVDSKLPLREWSEFMREFGFRVKTRQFGRMVYKSGDTLKRVVSQGLALPLSVLDEHPSDGGERPAGTEGQDVTHYLEVTKHEIVEDLTADYFGAFHPSTPKTGELRIQSYPKALGELQGKPYYVTTKIDGQSITVLYDDTGLHVYSAQVEMKPDSLFAQVAQQEGLAQVAQNNPNFAIQGELCGVGIRKNKLGLSEKQIFVFNVFDVRRNEHLEFEELVNFCIDNNLRFVPVMDSGLSFNLSMNELEEMARGNYQGTETPREGIVVRPQHNMYSRFLEQRLSFKFLNIDHLLKEK